MRGNVKYFQPITFYYEKWQRIPYNMSLAECLSHVMVIVSKLFALSLIYLMLTRLLVCVPIKK